MLKFIDHICTIYRPDEESYNSTGNLKIKFQLRMILKALKNQSCLSFRASQKKVVNLLTELTQFTDQQI